MIPLYCCCICKWYTVYVRNSTVIRRNKLSGLDLFFLVFLALGISKRIAILVKYAHYACDKSTTIYSRLHGKWRRNSAHRSQISFGPFAKIYIYILCLSRKRGRDPLRHQLMIVNLKLCVGSQKESPLANLLHLLSLQVTPVLLLRFPSSS